MSSSAHCARISFLFIDLVKEHGGYLGLPVVEWSQLHVRFHEDNVGALILGNLEPWHMTPRSKCCALEYHWFRLKVGPDGETASTIVTMGLGHMDFEQLQKKLMD